MPTTRTLFFCTECGNEALRWQGQCPVCRAWNTLVEAPATGAAGRSRGEHRRVRAVTAPIRLGDLEGRDAERWPTGLGELDTVLGGGIVPGSLILVGGEPGIGKSTLLLQAAARLRSRGREVLYASAEESGAQVRLRADRLDEDAAGVWFHGGTELDVILDAAETQKPSVLVIDSIQTVSSAAVQGAAGSVLQIRECTSRLQRFAKESGAAVLLVGHVTKEGAVAGPRTLEHLVDTVIYFEGTGPTDHRVLRATKNRFGAADELGVFRMTGTGLASVDNPSALFLSGRFAISGAAVAAVVEGSRPLLVEVQALCTRASYGAAQRVAAGFDRQRLALLLAVLERRAGVGFGDLDVFLNVVGGLRLAEPAADLAVALALVSSVRDAPLPPGTALCAEIGLGGELRPVAFIERRCTEAARQGFERIILAEDGVPSSAPAGLALEPACDLASALSALLPRR